MIFGYSRLEVCGGAKRKTCTCTTRFVSLCLMREGGETKVVLLGVLLSSSDDVVTSSGLVESLRLNEKNP
jgi:hypothetical protein